MDTYPENKPKTLNKKLFAIIALLLFVVIGVVLLTLLLVNRNNSTDVAKTPPVSATEVREAIDEIGNAVTNNQIALNDSAQVDKDEQVAVWVYSEPRFLGYFNVQVKDGVKYISGLTEAMKKVGIEAGRHNIVLVSNSGNVIGKVGVQIDNKGTVTKPNDSTADTTQSNPDNQTTEAEKNTTPSQPTSPTNSSSDTTTTKEITIQESIPFTSNTRQEVNMLRGTTSVQTAGVDGARTVTYRVTYNANGKEVNRTKIKETITKQSVTKITRIGVSDYNLNTDTYAWGSASWCTVDYDDNGIDSCPSDKVVDSPIFVAPGNNPDIAQLQQQISQWGTSRGYFKPQGGIGGGIPLDASICSSHGLACGRW